MKNRYHYKIITAGIAVIVIGLLMGFQPIECKGQGAKVPIYLNTSYSFKERAADLVSRMTPEEKQSQLGNTFDYFQINNGGQK